MVLVKKCPVCGTTLQSDAPDGLCPGCLLKQGLQIISTGGEVQTTVNRTEKTAESSKVFGDYEIIEPIAEGGMGIVYKAIQKSLNRIVAIKMIKSGQLATASEVQRFKTEAAAAARLDHPNIVPIYEIGEQDGIYFYSMRYIDGQNLSMLINKSPMNQKRAAKILSAIARAIHYAHQHGVLHRDLKPTNVLIDKNGEPLLTDFGLAKLLEQQESFTQSQAVFGSASYMSPEQALGKTAEISVSSDVYSLGAILYEMLTGRPPFIGRNFVETIKQVIDSEPVKPSEINPKVDPELEIICLKCLEKQPEHRYGSAGELAVELERWLNGEPILAKPATRLQKIKKWAKRKPAIATLVALLIIVATFGISGVLWQWREAIAAKQIAEQKAIDAAQQAIRAEKSALEAIRNLYVSDINLAQRALAENNRGRAYELLKKHIPSNNEVDLRGFEWRYLWNLTRGQEKISIQHHDFVESVLFSPDGNTLLTTQRDPFVYVWEIKSKKLIAKLGELDSPVARGTMFFSNDGSMLIFQTALSIYLFDSKNWTQIAQLQRANLPLFFLPDNQTVAAKSFVIGTLFFETLTWEPRDFPETQFADIGLFRAVSSDGRIYLISKGEEQTQYLQLWDISGKPISNPFICQFENPTAMAVSPNGRYVAVAEWRGAVRLWDAATGSEVSSWTAHESTVAALNFSYDSKTLVTAGVDQTIKTWEIPVCAHLATLYGHHNEVWSVCFSKDGKWIASGGKDSTAKIWLASTRTTENILTNAMSPLAFSPDSSKLLALGFDRQFQLWDTSSRIKIGNPLPLYSDYERTAIAVSKDLKFCLVGRRSGSTEIMNIQENGKIVKDFTPHAEPVVWLALSEDNRLLATATADEIKLWNFDNLNLIFSKTGFTGPLAISPDGKYLAGVDLNYNVKLWELQSGNERATFKGHKWTIWSITFTPDSNMLISAGMDGTAIVWNPHSGVKLATLSGHKEAITSIAVTPDARTLATGSTDDSVKFWSLLNFQELMTIDDFKDDVGSLLFSPDGTTLAVGCFTGSGSRQNVKLWQAPDLKQIDETEKSIK